MSWRDAGSLRIVIVWQTNPERGLASLARARPCCVRTWAYRTECGAQSARIHVPVAVQEGVPQMVGAHIQGSRTQGRQCVVLIWHVSSSSRQARRLLVPETPSSYHAMCAMRCALCVLCTKCSLRSLVRRLDWLPGTKQGHDTPRRLRCISVHFPSGRALLQHAADSEGEPRETARRTGVGWVTHMHRRLLR